MNILDVCERFKLTSINSQTDLIGLIVKLSRSQRESVCAAGGVGGGGGDSLWKGWLHSLDM